MEKIIICVPVMGKTLSEFVANLESSEKQADMVELRADSIQNLKLEDVRTIKNHIRTKSILTIRPRNEGGGFAGSEKQRAAILEKSLKLGFDFVDIELTAMEKSLVKIPKASKTKLIISHHNFSGTPDIKRLEMIAARMEKFRPYIIKIATMVRRAEDNRTLLKMMTSARPVPKRIVVGMGKKGVITRVIGPILGNFLTYAKIGNASAPGQPGASELKRIYDVINSTIN